MSGHVFSQILLERWVLCLQRVEKMGGRFIQGRTQKIDLSLSINFEARALVDMSVRSLATGSAVVSH